MRKLRFVHSCAYAPLCGLQQAAAPDARTGTKTREEKREAHAKWAEECKAIKIAGYKPQQYGMTREKAIREARALESRFPGIKFTVFTHDYL